MIFMDSGQCFTAYHTFNITNSYSDAILLGLYREDLSNLESSQI